jgi:hypothetical protein
VVFDCFPVEIVFTDFIGLDYVPASPDQLFVWPHRPQFFIGAELNPIDTFNTGK